MIPMPERPRSGGSGSEDGVRHPRHGMAMIERSLYITDVRSPHLFIRIETDNFHQGSSGSRWLALRNLQAACSCRPCQARGVLVFRPKPLWQHPCLKFEARVCPSERKGLRSGRKLQDPAGGEREGPKGRRRRETRAAVVWPARRGQRTLCPTGSARGLWSSSERSVPCLADVYFQMLSGGSTHLLRCDGSVNRSTVTMT